jgi:uncharacterized repeat protein (TIGR01451 family)
VKKFEPRSSRWCCDALRSLLLGIILVASGLSAPGQAPEIVTQPQSLSVLSGDTAAFTVDVTGESPLSFRWQQNGTNFVGGTNQNLTITNVQIRHYGDYVLIASNRLGAVTSVVAELRVDEQLTFRIVSLMTNGVIAVEASNFITDDKGGIGVSSNNVFVTGGTGDGDRARTGRFPIDTLSGAASLATGWDSMTGNLRTETVYSLGNGGNAIQFLNGDSSNTNVTTLLEIDGNTGALTGNRITLSSTITLPRNQEGNIGLFAGYDRVVIHNGVRVYNIDLPSGKVTDLGAMSSITHVYAESALAYWGMAEYWRGGIYIVYVQDSYRIVRTRVPDRQTFVITTFPDYPNYLSSMASIGFSISRSRWYAHVEGTTFLRQNGDETVGSAKASFTMDAGYPAITREPLDIVSYPSSNVTFTVQASGSAPLGYQWFFNDEPIPDAAGPTLTLPDIDETDEGYYSVQVVNASGSVASRQAYLTVYSVPEIVSNPISRSIFLGSNVTFSVTVNAAPPVSYQWRFNNVNIAGATNRFLNLNNVQPSAQGFYSVEVVNRFGSLTSEDAELRVVVPVDDGTVFQITSMGSNNVRTIEVFNSLGYYHYGPFAVGRQNVFYSTYYQSGYSEADNLSTSGALPNYLYGVLIGNLRSEKVYAGAQGSTLLDFSTGGTLTDLYELDLAGGRLTNHITLSMQIPLGPINTQIGFFSGYGRAVVLNGFRAYQILLPSGEVTDLGPMNTPQHAFSFSGAVWGIAENAGGINYIVYARNSQQMMRTRVPDGRETVFTGFQNLSSYMSGISASIRRGRWYFQHIISSQFANGTATVGFAPATFSINSGSQPDHFEWDPIPGLQLANQPFHVTIRALTSSNGLATNFTGTVFLQGLSVSNQAAIGVFPSAISNFVGGVWSGMVTVLAPNPEMFLRAIDQNDNRGDSQVFSANSTNDIIVQMTDSPDPVVLGQLLNYTAHITNTGPLTATGVVLTNIIPTNLVFVGAETTVGSCRNVGREVRCTIGDVAVGDVVRVIITTRAAVLGNVTNTVRVGRAEGDPSPGNNSATEVTTVSYPTLRVGDVSIAEGDSGTNFVAFPVYLSAPWTNTVAVNYLTSGGSAISIPPNNDFVSTFGTLTIPMGETTQYVTVPIRSDTLYESNEVFFLNLSSPSNAIIADAQGSCTIFNDDAMPLVSIHDASVTEGNSGTVNLLFPVRLSVAAGTPVTVRCSTRNGSATSGTDYVARTAVLTFQPNTTILTQNFSVQIVGDVIAEPTEVLFANITAITNAQVVRVGAAGRIINDDGAGAVYRFDWSPIAASVPTNTPIPVTITAKDVFGATVTSFSSGVSLSGAVPLVQERGRLLGDLEGTADFTGTGYTLGYYFSPSEDIVVTHVRSYTGYKVTIWRANGTLLGSQNVPTTEGFWVDTPLASPIPLAAGSSNIIALVGDNTDTYYFSTIVPDTFAHGVIGSSVYALGDAFPTVIFTGGKYLVDLIYTVGPASFPISIDPTSTTAFTSGVWTGAVSVLQVATNMQFVASDPAKHTGFSNPFNAGLDHDQDGMWDSWEIANSLNPDDPNDGVLDADNDGRSNLEEFLAGTDPQDPARLSLTVSGSTVHIRFEHAIPGRRFRLERCDSLNWTTWLNVAEFEVGNPPVVEITDGLSPGVSSRFYRVRPVGP